MTKRFSQKIGRMNRAATSAAAGTLASKVVYAIALFAASLPLVSAPPTFGAQADSQTPSPASPQPTGVTLTFNAPTDPVNAGTSFQVPVMLTGAMDVASFALMFHYDATKLTLVSILPGDVLNRDGESAPIIHSDSPIGHVVISIARPPGAPGVDGTGTTCLLTFQANATGDSDLKITRTFVVDSTHRVLPAHFAPAHIVVNQ